MKVSGFVVTLLSVAPLATAIPFRMSDYLAPITRDGPAPIADKFPHLPRSRYHHHNGTEGAFPSHGGNNGNSGNSNTQSVESNDNNAASNDVSDKHHRPGHGHHNGTKWETNSFKPHQPSKFNHTRPGHGHY